MTSQLTDIRSAVLEFDHSIRYKMGSANKGKCYIFSHDEFHPKLKLKKRKGAEEELKTMTDTYQNFGFDVRPFKNLKYKEIKKTLKKLANDNYQDDYAIIIIVSSHGKGGNFIYANDQEYFIDEIQRTLTNIKSLVGKPKLIFVQACRGEKMDYGIHLNLSDSDQDELDYAHTDIKIPKQADVLTAYSSPPGFLSWQTWFLPTLCRILNQNPTLDIETILMMTSDEVSRFVGNNDEIEDGMQMCFRETTLRKKCYFS